MLDYLSTENGKIASYLYANKRKHIPVYATNADLIYKSDFHLPRFTQGAYLEAFKQTFKFVYGFDIEINCFGKPSEDTF